jgi:acyl-CoA thioester hydrolase
MSRYAKTFTVRWADCDANGHMRNTAYSEYGIDVRMAWLSEAGFGFEAMQQQGFGPVLLREELDYFRELKMGEAVKVDLTQVGLSPDGARWKLQHELWKPDGKKAARIVILGGFLDLAQRRLVAPPEPLAKLFAEVEKAEGWEELPKLKSRG